MGYVSEVTESDLSANRFPGAGLGSIVGKAGLEREYDDTLRGAEGVRYIEVNARGRLVREEASTASLPPTPGQPIQTTIDLDLQRYIDSIWPPGVRGAMVAMTPEGEVRALYSAPSYDPNAFVGGISHARPGGALNNDEAKPLLNRAIRRPLSAGLAVQAGHRRDGAQARAHRLRHPHARCRAAAACGWATACSAAGRRRATARSTCSGAVAASCDVYFYQLGLRLGLRPSSRTAC